MTIPVHEAVSSTRAGFKAPVVSDIREEIWTKLYVQDRVRHDAADVDHIIRKMGDELDWERRFEERRATRT